MAALLVLAEGRAGAARSAQRCEAEAMLRAAGLDAPPRVWLVEDMLCAFDLVPHGAVELVRCGSVRIAAACAALRHMLACNGVNFAAEQPPAALRLLRLAATATASPNQLANRTEALRAKLAQAGPTQVPHQYIEVRDDSYTAVRQAILSATNEARPTLLFLHVQNPAVLLYLPGDCAGDVTSKITVLREIYAKYSSQAIHSCRSFSFVVQVDQSRSDAQARSGQTVCNSSHAARSVNVAQQLRGKILLPFLSEGVEVEPSSVLRSELLVSALRELGLACRPTSVHITSSRSANHVSGLVLVPSLEQLEVQRCFSGQPGQEPLFRAAANADAMHDVETLGNMLAKHIDKVMSANYSDHRPKFTELHLFLLTADCDIKHGQLLSELRAVVGQQTELFAVKSLRDCTSHSILRLAKLATAKRDALVVTIVDDCHIGVAKGGSQDSFLNAGFSRNAPNVVQVMISTTPENCLTSNSRIDPANVLSISPSKKKFVSVDDIVCSVIWQAKNLRPMQFDFRSCTLHVAVPQTWFVKDDFHALAAALTESTRLSCRRQMSEPSLRPPEFSFTCKSAASDGYVCVRFSSGIRFAPSCFSSQTGVLWWLGFDPSDFETPEPAGDRLVVLASGQPRALGSFHTSQLAVDLPRLRAVAPSVAISVLSPRTAQLLASYTVSLSFLACFAVDVDRLETRQSSVFITPDSQPWNDAVRMERFAAAIGKSADLGFSPQSDGPIGAETFSSSAPNQAAWADYLKTAFNRFTGADDKQFDNDAEIGPRDLLSRVVKHKLGCIADKWRGGEQRLWLTETDRTILALLDVHPACLTGKMCVLRVPDESEGYVFQSVFREAINRLKLCTKAGRPLVASLVTLAKTGDSRPLAGCGVLAALEAWAQTVDLRGPSLRSTPTPETALSRAAARSARLGHNPGIPLLGTLVDLEHLPCLVIMCGETNFTPGLPHTFSRIDLRLITKLDTRTRIKQELSCLATYVEFGSQGVPLPAISRDSALDTVLSDFLEVNHDLSQRLQNNEAIAIATEDGFLSFLANSEAGFREQVRSALAATADGILPKRIAFNVDTRFPTAVLRSVDSLAVLAAGESDQIDPLVVEQPEGVPRLSIRGADGVQAHRGQSLATENHYDFGNHVTLRNRLLVHAPAPVDIQRACAYAINQLQRTITSTSSAPLSLEACLAGAFPNCRIVLQDRLSLMRPDLFDPLNFWAGGAASFLTRLQKTTSTSSQATVPVSIAEVSSATALNHVPLMLPSAFQQAALVSRLADEGKLALEGFSAPVPRVHSIDSEFDGVRLVVRIFKRDGRTESAERPQVDVDGNLTLQKRLSTMPLEPVRSPLSSKRSKPNSDGEEATKVAEPKLLAEPDGNDSKPESSRRMPRKLADFVAKLAVQQTDVLDSHGQRKWALKGAQIISRVLEEFESEKAKYAPWFTPSVLRNKISNVRRVWRLNQSQD